MSAISNSIPDWVEKFAHLAQQYREAGVRRTQAS